MKKELKNVFILCACENNTFHSDHKLVFVEIDFEPAAQNRFCLLIINCQIIYEMKNNALHYANTILHITILHCEHRSHHCIAL